MTESADEQPGYSHDEENHMGNAINNNKLCERPPQYASPPAS